MSAIRLRLRHPAGTSTLSLPADATWSALQASIREQTGVLLFSLKIGYPPRELPTSSLAADTPLSAFPAKLNGEQLTVVPYESPVPPSPPPAAAAATAPQTSTSPPKPADPAQDPPEIPVPSLGGTLVLRVMPDDNSCLFRALGGCLRSVPLSSLPPPSSSPSTPRPADHLTAPGLRSLVAATILANPDIYTEAILGREPRDYAAWIQKGSTWGGGIELSILATEFGVEICSVNVQDGRVDRFDGTSSTSSTSASSSVSDAKRRCILVYSGIHYDYLSVVPWTSDDERAVFSVLSLGDSPDDEEDGGALAAALDLCKALRQRHYYTDTAGFLLRCGTCGATGNGEVWARGHARETGHGNFGEAG